MYLDKNFEDKLKCSVDVCVAEEKVYCVIEPKYVLFVNLTDCCNILLMSAMSEICNFLHNSYPELNNCL